MSACRYLMKSPEAYLTTTFGEDRVTMMLCEWPDQHPERFVDAPRWLLKQIGGGLAVRPERDCVGCPAYRPMETRP